MPRPGGGAGVSVVGVAPDNFDETDERAKDSGLPMLGSL